MRCPGRGMRLRFFMFFNPACLVLNLAASFYHVWPASANRILLKKKTARAGNIPILVFPAFSAMTGTGVRSGLWVESNDSISIRRRYVRPTPRLRPMRAQASAGRSSDTIRRILAVIRNLTAPAARWSISPKSAHALNRLFLAYPRLCVCRALRPLSQEKQRLQIWTLF